MDRYEEALAKARAGKSLEEIFPEMKESEDERIRKHLIEIVETYWGKTNEPGKAADLAWLEKQKEQPTNEEMLRTLRAEYEKGVADTIAKYEQKEQKPAEWSEEFLRLMGITISQDGNQVCVLLGENLAEGIAGFGDTLADAVEEFKKEWRQFDRFRKATWKPARNRWGCCLL